MENELNYLFNKFIIRMDSDNENQGFQHQADSFDLVQLLQHPILETQQKEKNQVKPLQAPISTFVQMKNCNTPSFLNNQYSKIDTIKQPKLPTENRTRLRNINGAWMAGQQKYLEEQFTQEKYKIIYKKFKQDKSNYNYYRQYAKHQYKTFTDEDSIEQSSEQQELRVSQKRTKLDLLKIERIMSPVAKQLKFRSNFESGNLQMVYIKNSETQSPIDKSWSGLRKTSSASDSSSLVNSSLGFGQSPKYISKQYYLILSNDTNTIGFNQWFYFKVHNSNYEHQIKATFIILNINKRTIPNIHQIGINYFSLNEYKFSRVGWNRLFDGILINNKNNLKKDDINFYHTLQFQMNIKPKDTVYFSLALPYTFTKLKQFMTQHSGNFQIMGSTFCGNPIYVYKTGNQKAEKSILITARQHPSEISSSYVVEGLINRLSKSSPLLSILKKKYQIYVLPMVNPDGVIHGNSRTNLLGYDVNRKWEAVPNKRHSYEVFNIVTNLAKKIPKIQYLIDLHGHSKKLNSFAYFSTKKSVAALIVLQMAEKLPWFKVSDSQMAITAPINTLRWFSGAHLNIQKAITIQTSIHGWSDDNNNVFPFTPQKMQLIGSTLIDALCRLQLQKKSALKSLKNINFAQCHQSSDSDPEGDYIKQFEQANKIQQNVIQSTLNKQQQKKLSPSTRKLRIKTFATNFYKPTFNSTIRQRIKTEYAIQKLNIELASPPKTMNRKKTIQMKYYRIKQTKKTSTRKITLSNYEDLNQSITFKPILSQGIKDVNLDLTGGRLLKKKQRKFTQGFQEQYQAYAPKTVLDIQIKQRQKPILFKCRQK